MTARGIVQLFTHTRINPPRAISITAFSTVGNSSEGKAEIRLKCSRNEILLRALEEANFSLNSPGIEWRREADMDESLKFLSKVFDLLGEANVFDTRSNESKSIVDFKHPEELKVRQKWHKNKFPSTIR